MHASVSLAWLALSVTDLCYHNEVDFRFICFAKSMCFHLLQSPIYSEKATIYPCVTLAEKQFTDTSTPHAHLTGFFFLHLAKAQNVLLMCLAKGKSKSNHPALNPGLWDTKPTP